MRGSFLVDGDIIANVNGHLEYIDKQVDMSPILGFDIFDESSHTGAAIARWKTRVFSEWKMEGAVGVSTEDGASNNPPSRCKLCSACRRGERNPVPEFRV